MVTIFIVEPGGCSAENAIPASACSPPVRGSITAIPAYWPASASTAAVSIPGLIVVCTAPAFTGLTLASTRLPANSLPPTWPARRVWKMCSSPLEPTLASAG